LTPSCTSRQHGWTFSSPCAYVCAFRLPHTLHIRLSFIESLGISNILLSLGFGILPLLRWILLIFLDADFAGCGIDRKSTSGTCYFFGSSLVCWSSQKQSSVSQSTTEAVYVASTSCCYQILWIVHTMRDFGVIFDRVSLMCDKTSTISVAKSPVFHKRMRHLERRHHCLRDHIEKEDIEMIYIDTERQLTNIFTKPLDASCIAASQGEISVCHPSSLV
jgi:hypothetical protein